MIIACSEFMVILSVFFNILKKPSNGIHVTFQRNESLQFLFLYLVSGFIKNGIFFYNASYFAKKKKKINFYILDSSSADTI